MTVTQKVNMLEAAKKLKGKEDGKLEMDGDRITRFRRNINQSEQMPDKGQNIILDAICKICIKNMDIMPLVRRLPETFLLMFKQ